MDKEYFYIKGNCCSKLYLVLKVLQPIQKVKSDIKNKRIEKSSINNKKSIKKLFFKYGNKKALLRAPRFILQAPT